MAAAGVEIRLERHDGVFAPGDSVRGCVCVQSAHPAQCPAVSLTIKGDGKVFVKRPNERELLIQISRSEVHPVFMSIQPVYDVARASYVTDTKVLLGSVHSKSDELNSTGPGQHVYPFEFCLPQALPCSYESSRGRVQYKLTCRVESPVSTSFDKCKKLITVLPRVDINLLPGMLESAGDAASTTFYTCFCETPPISAEISIQRRGYVPGEFIAANAFVSNMSNERVLSMTIELVQSVKHKAFGSVRTEDYIVKSVKGQSLEVGRTLAWNSVNVEVPPVPSTTLQLGQLIEVSYRLQIRVVPANSSRPLIAKVGVTIGTIPHSQVTHDYLQHYRTIAYQARNRGARPMAADIERDTLSIEPPPVTYREGPNVLSNEELKDERRDRAARDFPSFSSNHSQQLQQSRSTPPENQPPKYTEFRPKYIFYNWMKLYEDLTRPYDLPPNAC